MRWPEPARTAPAEAQRNVFDPLTMPEATNESLALALPSELPLLGISKVLKLPVAGRLADWCTHGVSATFSPSFSGCQMQRMSTGTLGLWFQNCGKQTQLTVSGPFSFAPLIPHKSLCDSVLLFIRPGAAHAILGFPVAELTCRGFALDDLLPGEGARLLQRIVDVTSPVERLQVMQDWVHSRITRFARARDHELTTGLVRWLAAPGRLTDLLSEVGGSQRQVQRWFAEGVGLAPRELDILWQVGRVARRSMIQERPEWATLAASHGFSDQSHLVRRWREVLGDSPARFHRRWRAGGGWLDGLMVLPPEPSDAPE